MPKAGNTPPGFPVGNKTTTRRGRDLPPQDRDWSAPQGGDPPPGVEGRNPSSHQR